MDTQDRSQIDEALYSRQLYVMGHDAQKRMAGARILVIGVNGLGVEIAKNIVLAGVREVVLLDDEPASMLDLSSNFYLSESSVGMSRAEVTAHHLQTLNPYVKVSKRSNKEDALAALEGITVAVLVNQPLSYQIVVNKHCREMGVKFISASTYGVFGSIFNDFGEDFLVVDSNGEECRSVMISAITKDSPASITCLDEHRHDFETGDFVTFGEVQGMIEINDLPPSEIVVTGPYTFTLKRVELETFHDYIRGGYAAQVKMPVKMSFDTLEESLRDPSMVTSDFAKFDRLGTLHACFRGLESFTQTREDQSLPRSGHDGDAKAFLEFLTSEGLIDETDLVRDVAECFARTCRGSISPMAATLGGIAGQEVLKAVTGKFSPLKQFFYFDCSEVLPSPLPSEADCKASNSRYDGQIAVFGKAFQEKILDLHYFLVGAGAIGCEMLKNWAMMGVGAGSGKVIVTDMDQIEKSNLSRQFLFRDRDIGRPKSSAAAAAVKQMNPGVNVESHLERVGPETESFFDDDFWESLSGVCNALDNVQARLYVDQRCVYYRKSLLESGTLGTKGNVQVIVPFLTESYGSSRDPPEKSIPICTLKNFPYQIEHTIQWARDYFEGTFRTICEDANAFLSNPDGFVEELHRSGPGAMLSKLESIHQTLASSRPSSAEDCFRWARLVFEELFSSSIKQLIHAFPHDMLDSHGVPFWSGTKRAPTPIEFDSQNPAHMDFIIAAGFLRAEAYGFSVEDNFLERVPRILDSVMVPEFVPKVGVKIATTDAEAKAMSEGGSTDLDDQRIQEILRDLKSISMGAEFRLNPIEFEKDDDTNHHVDFVTSCSNLRARNYLIEPADRYKTKRIAGKIIPAIATTTAFVTGLVCIEMYKLVKLGYTDRPSERVLAACRSFPHAKEGEEETKTAEKLLELLKNGYANLALPFFAFSEPIAAPKREMRDGIHWTLWDRFEVEEGRDITLKEFLDLFQERYKLEVVMISCGVSILYSSFVPSKKLSERLPMTISSIAQSVGKLQFAPKQRYLILEVCCCDETGEDVEVPYIRYRFR